MTACLLLLLLLLARCCGQPLLNASSAYVTNLAGAGTGSIDGLGLSAAFANPSSVALSSTTLYVSDWSANRIRAVSFAGVATTLVSGAVTANGVGTAAGIMGPSGIALDPTGALLYVISSREHSVRVLAIANASVTTLAGTGAAAYVNGQGSAAAFANPIACAVTPDGALFIGDTNNNRLRRCSPSGLVTLFAGSGVVGAADGVGSNAQFSALTFIAADGFNLFVSDTGAREGVAEQPVA